MIGRMSAIAAFAAAVLAGPAVASEAAVLKRVHYADLNLESSVGRNELDRRLDRAVRAMCAVSGMPSSSALDAEQARCMDEASAGLDGQIDAAVRANRARTTRMASAGN